MSKILVTESKKKSYPNTKILFMLFSRFFFIGICITLCSFTFYFHYKISGKIPPSEYSLTEILQEILLFIDILMFGFIAYKNKILRESAILFAGFTACMLVRELDFLFDFFHRDLWKLFVFFIVILSFYVTFWKNGLNKTLSSLVRLTNSRGFSEVFYGIMLILVISRFMGMNKLWLINDYVKNDYYLHKRFVEETLELYGYCIYTIGLTTILLKSKNKKT